MIEKIRAHWIFLMWCWYFYIFPYSLTYRKLILKKSLLQLCFSKSKRELLWMIRCSVLLLSWGENVWFQSSNYAHSCSRTARTASDGAAKPPPSIGPAWRRRASLSSSGSKPVWRLALRLRLHPQPRLKAAPRLRPGRQKGSVFLLRRKDPRWLSGDLFQKTLARLKPKWLL